MHCQKQTVRPVAGARFLGWPLPERHRAAATVSGRTAASREKEDKYYEERGT